MNLRWIVPALVLPAFAVLIGLGLWQMDRRDWKLALIERAETRAALDPVALPAQFDAAAWDYRRLRVTGIFDHARELYMYRPGPHGAAGWHVVTPLETPTGWVLVLRGFVDPDHKDPATRPGGQITDPVSLVGHVRLDETPGPFAADNDPDANVWFYRDAAAMAGAMGIQAAPWFIEADATPNRGGWPLGGQTRLRFKNDHLGYALTWFGLAAALAGVAIAYIIRARSNRKPT